MKIPRLDKRVTIQYLVYARNTEKEEISTWTDLATVWASIEPVTSSQAWAAQAIQDGATVLVKIRYRRNFRPEWRFKFGYRIFEITGAPMNPDEENRWLFCTCRERLEQVA